jgi:hypothetical protein
MQHAEWTWFLLFKVAITTPAPGRSSPQFTGKKPRFSDHLTSRKYEKVAEVTRGTSDEAISLV